MTIGKIMISFLCTCIFNYFEKAEWVTIGTTFLGLLASVYIAYRIFNAEQEAREIEEIKLNKDHFKFLENFLKMQMPYYEKQVQNINLYLKNLDKHLNLEIVVELNNDYSKNFELIRLIKYIHNSKKNEENFNKLYSSINYTSIVIKNLEDEMLRYFERSYLLDEKVKSVQYHLLRIHLIEINDYCSYDKNFNNDYGKIRTEYFELVKKVSNNPKIFPKSDEGLVDKNLLETEFVDKLITLINPVFADHPIFTEIASKLNTFKNAINDKRNLENAHRATMNSYVNILKVTKERIKEFYFVK